MPNENYSASSTMPHVLILGAGIAGMTLAQALRKMGWSFEIFEQDEGIDARTQGWAVALHSVIQDLREMMPDDMEPLESTNHLLPLDDAPQICMYFNSMKATAEPSERKAVIRANRQKLRKWLASNLDIKFGKRVDEVETTRPRPCLVFSDGTSATGDILVGADGVNSFVRKTILGGAAPLRQVPVSTVVGQLTLNKVEYEKQMQLGRSVSVAMGQDCHIFTGLNAVFNDASSARYYWFVNYSDPDPDKPLLPSSASREVMLDFAKLKTKTLDPRFTEIIHKTKPEEILYPTIIYRDLLLPEIPFGSVTLIGDAAHPMVPFRGEGASQAMTDALKLAKTLKMYGMHEIGKALKEYEYEMRPRGHNAVELGRLAFSGQDNSRTAWGQVLKVSEWQ